MLFSVSASLRRFMTPLARLLTLGLLTTLVTFSASADDVADSGSWTKKGYEIEGKWSLVAEDGNYFVELDSDFSTKKAPDLKLFLSSTPLSRVTNKNAVAVSVLIAPLESHRGAQRYALPKGIELGKFKTLLIHCEKYSKLWGGAALSIEH